MTISQRLTRAGLTFILLGTVAAVLPQQDEAVEAADCTLSGGTFRLSTSTANNPPAVNSYTSLTTTAYALNAEFEPSGSSNFTNVSADNATLSVTAGTLTLNGGSPTTVTAPGSTTNSSSQKSYSVKLAAASSGTSQGNQGTLTVYYTTGGQTYQSSVSLSGPT